MAEGCNTADFVPQVLTQEAIPAVAALEARLQITPWNMAQITSTLEAGYPGWVLQNAGGTVAAYLLALPVADEANLLLLGTQPELQRSGLASRLWRHAASCLQALGAQCCFLEVRESNQVAQLFYQRHGFSVVGRRRDYYASAQGGREDALVMRVMLP